METTRKRLVPCENAKWVEINPGIVPPISLVVGTCLHVGHRWHSDVWWHDPDAMRSSLFPVFTCPQREHHTLLVNRACGLCTYGSYYRTDRRFAADAIDAITSAMRETMGRQIDNRILHGGELETLRKNINYYKKWGGK